tara:strand:- start:1526 stop:1780 length:255 start_codon:yes stop_codon:yes gene_type:complete
MNDLESQAFLKAFMATNPKVLDEIAMVSNTNPYGDYRITVGPLSPRQHAGGANLGWMKYHEPERRGGGLGGTYNRDIPGRVPGV